ncbi:MAG TPA: guanylate kinase [Candidatus Sulfotelmatobacter sp.]|nr:guanylate kinase [Candidatus Sulfotelmatobacter sp.]
MSTTPIQMRRRGVMLIVSSPSGAGKTTISRLLLEREKDLTMSVSATTRPRRPSEVSGRDYHFIDRGEYDRMVERSEFLEHAEVFGNGYGTPRAPVEKALAEGRDILFDVDWQGARQMAQSARADMVSVFILPPSYAELERRLRTRAQDSDEAVARRMAKAADEMSHWHEYDYIIINHDVEVSVNAVQSILTAERHRRDRQLDLAPFVATMRAKD